ncbi:hypothetical protein ACHAXT_007225 [Thalassiosira profunda]
MGGRHLELVDRHDQSSRGRYDGMPPSSDYRRSSTDAPASPSALERGAAPTPARPRSNSDCSLASIQSAASRASAKSSARRSASRTNGRAAPVVGDLVFSIEGGPGSSPTAQDDDSYFGMDDELDYRLERRRKKRRMAGAALLVAFVAGIFAHGLVGGRHGEQEAAGADARGNNGGDINIDDAGGTTESVAEQLGELHEVAEEAEAELWPIADPPPAFTICPPPLQSDVHSQKHAARPVFHVGRFATIPEAPSQQTGTNAGPTEGALEDWAYDLSALDLSDDASMISVGFSDYSGPPTNGTVINWDRLSVGMVRTFAHDCNAKQYKQIGQDLRGSHDGEMFGHRLSTSADGRTVAIGAPSRSYDGGNGFVNVYYLDETSATNPTWTKLGSRIDNLDSNVKNYDRIGHALALGETGQTLAILGVTDVNTYVVRVYKFNEFRKEWDKRGKSLTVHVRYGDAYEFAPQLGLDDAGNTLSISHPELGVVQYTYRWQTSKWIAADAAHSVNFTAYPPESDPGGVDYDHDGETDEAWWISGVATDRAADVVAFAAWEDSVGANAYHAVKLVDFSTGTPSIAYNVTWTDYDVKVNVAVAKEGTVAAVVVSKTDVDDDEFWADASTVGALTVLTRGEAADGDGEASPAWNVVGEGGGSDGMGVLGNFVSVSGDGRIVAIGSTDVVELYGVVLPAGEHTATTEEAQSPAQTQAGAAAGTEFCPPFPDVASGTAPDTILDSLPVLAGDEHTLAIALSADASFLAVGIDACDGEERGMARIYGWSCAAAAYVPVGQDLFGKESFDGFGQSVDLSSDGQTVVVGANQPPPGKHGYAEVYSLSEEDGNFAWTRVGHRIAAVPGNAGDLGREVKISHDGTIVTLLGSILSLEDGYVYGHSFVHTVRLEDGEWKPVGDDLIGSVDYDEHGTEAHVTMSGDGGTIAVVGSYGGWLAKVYTYDAAKKNWTEVVIPTPGALAELDDGDDDAGAYVDYDDDASYSYFSGGDVGLNGDGTTLAVAGTAYTGMDETAVVRLLRLEEGGNWTVSSDPVDFMSDYKLSAVDVDDAGRHVAIGINSHSEDKTYQGSLFVATSVGGDNDGDDMQDWASDRGTVAGAAANDLLGSRVAIASDGSVAAASSRKGYVAFFKT